MRFTQSLERKTIHDRSLGTISESMYRWFSIHIQWNIIIVFQDLAGEQELFNCVNMKTQMSIIIKNAFNEQVVVTNWYKINTKKFIRNTCVL